MNISNITVRKYEPYILSRKVLYSIRYGVECLKNGIFTEKDIKMLLVDLREMTKHFDLCITSTSDKEFTKAIKNFFEVCNFVAHASRDRGIVENLVRDHALKLRANLDKTLEDFSEIPVNAVLDADMIATSLIFVAFQAIRSSDHTLNQECFFPLIHEQRTEIALCILSLLQDATIKLKDDEGFGFLHLMQHNGFYRLYCRLLNSRIELDARKSTGGSGRFVLGFPVMLSSARCLDTSIFPESITTTLPPIYETYRDTAYNLQLRSIKY